MKELKKFNEFINSNKIIENFDQKLDNDADLNKMMRKILEEIYIRAYKNEINNNVNQTFEDYMKEKIILLAEMYIRILKENTDILKNIANLALKKTDQKIINDKIAKDIVYYYLNNLINNLKEAFSEKIDDMSHENAAIATIAIKILKK